MVIEQINPIFSIAILIVSVVAHEVSHGYVADMLGDPTARLAGRLTLNPLKHIDPLGSIVVPILTSMAGFAFGWAKPVPYNPYNIQNGNKGVAMVAAAGPLTNIFIATIFAVIIKTRALEGLLPNEIISLLVYIVIINLVLAIFNITPIPPFDGSKILFSLLPYKYRKVEEFFERNQLLILFIFIFFVWGMIITPILNFALNFILS